MKGVSRGETIIIALLMANLKQGADQMAALDGINAALDGLGDQIDKLEAAAADGTITPEELDAVVARIDGFTDRVAALAPEPPATTTGDTTPAEPTA